MSKLAGKRKYAVVLRRNFKPWGKKHDFVLMSDDTGTPFTFNTPEEAHANVYENIGRFVGVVLIGRYVEPAV